MVDLGQASLLRAGGAGEITEVIDRERNVGGEGLADGLAVLPGLGDGDLLEVLLHAVRDAVQDEGAFGRGGLAPGGGGLVGGVEGELDVGGLTAGHLAEHLTGDRGDVVHVLAVDGCHPLAADVVVVALAVVDDRSVGAGVRVHGHDGVLSQGFEWSAPHHTVTRATFAKNCCDRRTNPRSPRETGSAWARVGSSSDGPDVAAAGRAAAPTSPAPWSAGRGRARRAGGPAARAPPGAPRPRHAGGRPPRSAR